MQQNPIQLIQAFNQFRQNFSGDPKAEVERLLRSGRLNQNQLNQLQQQARAFQEMLRNFR